MREFDERVARWVVLGSASGEPLTAERAAAALEWLLAADPAGTALFVRRRPSPLDVLNDVLAREDPCGSGVAAVFDLADGVVGFIPFDLSRPV